MVLLYVKPFCNLFMMDAKMAKSPPTKRGYDLRKRLENMDQTRREVLEAARRQLEEDGYRQMTMASLATESGVTRQTIHNLFGSKRAVLEALFDTLALQGGMERMREVMHTTDSRAMLVAFIQIFCKFWNEHRTLLRRIHGIGAIDPDFGEILKARNERRHTIALRIAKNWKSGQEAQKAAATLTALTSFEFYDTLLVHGTHAEDTILKLALATLGLEPAGMH
jgi:AcrR family transcriptional regulator